MGKRLALSILMLTGSMAQAELAVQSGVCKLETTGEVIQMVNKDPSRHFGLFSEGLSSEGFRVYLSQNFSDAIDIHIQAVGSGGYALIPRNSAVRTQIRTGVVIPRGAGTAGEWLSCDLVVVDKTPKPKTPGPIF